MKKIALFGGSFDPPHRGHIAIVKEALRQLDIDELIVVPAYLNPFKTSSGAPAALRLEWLRAIFAGESAVRVSDFEVRQNRPVPTIETVRHFRPEAETIYLIIGADNLASLKSWYAFEALDALVEWVVAKRDGVPVPETYRQLEIDAPVSSTRLREHMESNDLPEIVAEAIRAYYKEINAKEN